MTARRRPSKSRASEPLSPEASARAEAYRCLARAPRSAAEIENHLRARGVADALVAATLAFLTERGYVDDDALATRRAEELLLRRGHGVLRVRHELTLRGLADTVVERAITAVLEDRRPTDLARRALARRFGERSLVTAADRARAFRFLVGRGHPEDVVSAVLDEER
jgi:SOS response regulatory protein OraA/RecX